MHVTYKFIASY
jgi:hypothetical protein